MTQDNDTSIGYDFGGSEFPFGPNYTVVDVQPICTDNVVMDEYPPFINKDLRQDFSNLPQKESAVVGATIRYLEKNYMNFEDDEDTPDPTVYARFATCLNAVIMDEIVLRDHMKFLIPVMEALMLYGWEITNMELSSPPDRDDPAEYIIELQRFEP